MSAADYVRALMFFDAHEPMDDAELIVRMARPTRWPAARFEAADVERAARAIKADPGYFDEVYSDALATMNRAGVRCGTRVYRARRALSTPEGDER